MKLASGIFVGRLIALFGFCVFAGAGFADSVKARTEIVTNLESYSSTDQILFRYALSDVTDEFLRKLNADFQKQEKLNHFSKMKVQKNSEVTFDNKPSGIVITSYEPAQIKYKGSIWTYSKSKTFEANYVSLMEVLRPKKVGWLDLVLPKSYADDEFYDGELVNFGSGFSGNFVSCLASTTYGSLARPFCFPAGAIAWLTKAAFGQDNDVIMNVNKRAHFRKPKRPVAIVCGKDDVTVKSGETATAGKEAFSSVCKDEATRAAAEKQLNSGVARMNAIQQPAGNAPVVPEATKAVQ